MHTRRTTRSVSPRATATTAVAAITVLTLTTSTGALANLSNSRTTLTARHSGREASYHTDGTQKNAVWPLTRLNRNRLVRTNTVATYAYPDSGGAGVALYIVDTGIQTGLAEFGNRLQPGYDATTNTEGPTTDCTGHGTAVAGVAASNTYGVAKNVTIIPVRVTDCHGWATGANLTRGLTWILTHHKKGTPGVVNISLGSLDPQRTPGYAAQDNAVASLVRSGLFVTVSAGNDSSQTWSGVHITSNTVIDACQASPARVPAAFTVGAFDPLNGVDARSYFSNAGTCIDGWAPGADIATISRTGCKSIWHGTSFAAPIAAGLAALILAQFPTYSPAQVAGTLQKNGQRDGLVNTKTLPLDSNARYTSVVDAAHLVKVTSKSVNLVLRAPSA